ncbi:MAG: ATP-binding protein [Streptosporangiaceae bacterium]
MADGSRRGETGGSGQAMRSFSSALAAAPPILDLAFDSGTLQEVRAKVRTQARQAGLSDGRAVDVVLAVHELAANAVRHGAGAARLRLWNLAGALHCQVDDGSPPAPGHDAGPAGRHDADQTGATSIPGAIAAWQTAPGHGLRVVLQVADRMQVLPGPQGSRVTVTFDLRPG